MRRKAHGKTKLPAAAEGNQHLSAFVGTLPPVSAYSGGKFTWRGGPMLSVPGSDLLAANERQVFIGQFEKDVEFFELFFLLVNRSCPIKNLDLVWVEQTPSGRASVRRLGIDQALASRYSRLLGLHKTNPHPFFCNIINDFGRHQAESCALSDKAAEEVVRKTGRPQVYRCRFGLIDIAVPVIVKGQHIATIFTGQVMRERPSREGFRRVKSDACKLPYINLKQSKRPIGMSRSLPTRTSVTQPRF